MSMKNYHSNKLGWLGFQYALLLGVGICISLPMKSFAQDEAAAAVSSGASAASSADADGAGNSIEIGLDVNSFLNTSLQPGKLGINSPGHSKIAAAFQKFEKDKVTCTSRHSWAANSCLEFLSDHLTGGISAINQILALTNVMGVNDACSTMGKAMDVTQKALTAYSAACGTMKAGCGSSCVTARKSLEEINKSMDAAVSSATCISPTMPCNLGTYKSGMERIKKALAPDADEKNPISMAGKAQICEKKYSALLQSAGVGLISVVKSFSDANKCDEDSQGNVVKNPDVEKCSLTENAQLPECICLVNPTNAGCPQGPTIAGTSPGVGSGIGTYGSDFSGASASGGGLSDSDLASLDLSSGAPNGNADISGSGAPIGGGGGSAGLSGGGGGSGGAGAGEGEGSGKSGLNTNILSGAGGGGGGGGSWGSSGRSGDGEYRAYLPGGAKDPARGIAGQGAAWSKEVTGHGGKSNWEKVRDRYRDNRSTLLAN